jgi:stress-induced-phosphoprotein 1
VYGLRTTLTCYFQDFESALKDANKCIQIKPDWGKVTSFPLKQMQTPSKLGPVLIPLEQGYGRQGAAYHGLGDLKAAEASYRKGLEVEPGNYPHRHHSL